MPLREQNAHAGTIYQEASHHRVGSSYGVHPDDTPDTSQWDRRSARTTTEDDALYEQTRLPNSSRRYRGVTQKPQPIINVTHHAPEPLTKRRASVGTAITRSPRPSVEPVTRPNRQLRQLARRRYHWAFYVGLALIVGILGWVIITVVLNWWHMILDDWHYGRPRTAQYDVVVGHHDSSAHPTHIIAANVGGQAYIVEIQGGDGEHTKIYLPSQLTGPGADLAPVTVEFRDVNGDHHPDMLVTEGDHLTMYINDPDKQEFRPLHQGETVHI